MSAVGAEVRCFVRRCPNPVVGLGPYSGRHVCNLHMGHELKKVGDMQSEIVIPRLEEFDQLMTTQRSLQQRLYCERQELETAFDSAMDALEAGKRRLVSQVESELACINEGISACDRAGKLGSQLREAQQAGDAAQVFRLSGQLAPLKAAAEAGATPGRGVKTNLGPKALGLAYLLEEELRRVFNETDNDAAAWSRLAGHTFADGRPVALAACPDVTGYVATSPSGSKQDPLVVALGTSVNPSAAKSIPSPCIVVALAHGDSTEARRLCLVSLLAADKPQHPMIQLAGAADADSIVGLHCDCPRRGSPGRQRLFVAMTTSCILVAGLDGRALARVTQENVGLPLGRIASLSGTQDKLIIYRCEPDCRLLAVAKEAEVIGTLHLQVAMPNMRHGSPESVAAMGSHCALITDSVSGGCDVWCMMSCMQLDRLKAVDVDQKKRPVSVFVDSRGLIFSCSPEAGAVHALAADGRLLQSLASNDCKAPSALTVCELVEDGDGSGGGRDNANNAGSHDRLGGRVKRFLAVADAANRSIVVFSLP